MTLEQFRNETAGLPDSTEILVLSPWGDIEPSAWVGLEDLAEDDPVREGWPEKAILLTSEAS